MFDAIITVLMFVPLAIFLGSGKLFAIGIICAVIQWACSTENA